MVQRKGNLLLQLNSEEVVTSVDKKYFNLFDVQLIKIQLNKEKENDVYHFLKANTVELGQLAQQSSSNMLGHFGF